MKERKRFSMIRFNRLQFSSIVPWALLFIFSGASINQLWPQNISDISTKLEPNTANNDPHFEDLQDQSQSVFASLRRDHILNMTLKTDQQRLITEKEKKEYQPGRLIYQDNNGETITSVIEVKTRGNMRLNKCVYSPLKIKLTSSSQSLNLVLGCEPNDQHQQALLREYLVYKLYSVISYHSFRVQLVNLHLEDAEGNEKPRDTYAFILEPLEEVVSRINGKIHRPNVSSTKDVRQRAYQALALFQYFVGNTDWQVSSQHNIKLITAGAKNDIVSVPYDFDHAGLVNSLYAMPDRKMPIASVQDRFFTGDCDLNGYGEIANMFINKQDELLNVPKNCAQLTDASRAYVMKYLQRSLEILEDRNHLQEEIERGCSWLNK